MMNALKFLAVDRSLDSGKDFVGRFQMRELGMLPVLTEKRPASEAPEPETSSGPQKSRRSMWRRLVGWVGRVTPEGMNSTGPSAGSQPELQPFRQPASVESAIVVAPSETKADGGGRFARFTGYNPFNRTEKRAVQAEFRFENVRVVCNELHDTDFIIKT